MCLSLINFENTYIAQTPNKHGVSIHKFLALVGVFNEENIVKTMYIDVFVQLYCPLTNAEEALLLFVIIGLFPVLGPAIYLLKILCSSAALPGAQRGDGERQRAVVLQKGPSEGS